MFIHNDSYNEVNLLGNENIDVDSIPTQMQTEILIEKPNLFMSKIGFNQSESLGSPTLSTTSKKSVLKKKCCSCSIF